MEEANARLLAGDVDDGGDFDGKTKMGLLNSDPKKKKKKTTADKGGFRTIPFIILNEAFHTLASTGLNANMVIYLTSSFHMEAAAASSFISLWAAASSALAVFGASLSDSFLGRFRVIVLGCCFSLLGTTLFWSTAMLPQLHPPATTTATATPFQLSVLYASLGLISLGAGCLLPCSMAFGADQLDNKDNPDNDKVLQRFFNWYYAVAGAATLLGLTVLVYVQDSYGWEVGLAVPAFLILFSALLFLLPSSIYVKHEAKSSLFAGCFRVVVAAVRKAARVGDGEVASLGDGGGGRFFQGRVGSGDFTITCPTPNFRCLNKACFIANPETDINPADGSATDPWNLCTIEEVEAVKSILRVLPICSTGILHYVTLVQYPFMTLQAETMNRHIFPNSTFQLPPGSLNCFVLLSFTLCIVLYDSTFVPILARITGNPRGLSTNVRLGAGMVLSVVAMAISGVVESVRRGMAIQQPDNAATTVDMSVLWLAPALLLLGMAQTLNSIEQIAFYYSQLPKSMASIAVSLYTMVTAIGSLVSSFLINAVDGLTSGRGKASWLSTDLEEGHLDYYYWLIAGLCLGNFVYFLLCCRAFTPPAA
ncbi:unnamed protein product [Linum trigynum]|uniref:Uncharacterized protein n=1 Tax=Linum trigynum TaxID=586398 RepID=A0AAV2DII3_9ROSI